MGVTPRVDRIQALHPCTAVGLNGAPFSIGCIRSSEIRSGHLCGFPAHDTTTTMVNNIHTSSTEHYCCRILLLLILLLFPALHCYCYY